MSDYYERAEQELPHQWYESTHWKFPARFLFVVCAVAWLYSFIEGNALGLTPAHFTLLAAAIYGLGSISDRETTIAVVSEYNKLPDSVFFEFRESYGWVSDLPNREELYNVSQVALDYAWLAIGMIVPPLGVYYGLVRMTVAANNQKIRDRILLAGSLASEDEEV